MRLDFQITGADGADGATLELRRLDDRVNAPLQPLLEALGAGLWAEGFQQLIRDGGSPEAPWPELHPATVKIREYYGHGGREPVLIRSGQLLHSIGILDVDDRRLEVGSRDPAAKVHFGGTFTDRRGRTRKVQAFPWAVVTHELAEETFEILADELLGPAP